MWSDNKVIDVHRFNLLPQCLRQFNVQLAYRFISDTDMAELRKESHARAKEFRTERFLRRSLDTLCILFEELQVLAKIEDVEKLLIITRSKQISPQPCATTN